MGGQGPGHKSWEAREARLVNIQKARAARRRAPLPWRSGMESRIIEQLVWQWFLEARGWRLEAGAKNSGQRTVNGGQRENQHQIPHTAAFVHVPLSRQTRRPVRNDKLHKPWAKARVARFLGVSHTWVNKLVKRFEADPERMRRKMAAFALASIDKLERAREETRWERERGRLRGPIRYRRVKVMLQGKKTRVVAATRAEGRRRQAEVESERAALRQAQGQPYGLSAREGAMYLPYGELPAWAKGMLLPSDPAIVAGRRWETEGQPKTRTPATAGKPRPVPFVFRRRR